MAMMGGGGGRKSGGADEMLDLLRVVADPEKANAKLREILEREQAAQVAEAESLKAAQHADHERQAALAAAEISSRRLLELKEEQEAFEVRKAEVDARHAGTAEALKAEEDRLLAEADRLATSRANLESQAREFGAHVADRKARLQDMEMDVATRLHDANRAKEEADAVLVRVHKRLATLEGAIAQAKTE